VRGSASCSDRRIENGLPDVEFGVVIIVWDLTWELAYFCGSGMELLYAVLTRFAVWCDLVFLIVEKCPRYVFYRHYGGPVNFQTASAMSWKLWSFTLVCSCRVEWINPMRGAVFSFLMVC
jgi:hypothetical protein